MVRPKLAKLISKQVRIILIDGRHLVGKLLSFDAHMNLVIDHAQEFRKTKAEQLVQRNLGLVMLRGDQIISATSESSYMDNKELGKTHPITLQL